MKWLLAVLIPLHVPACGDGLRSPENLAAYRVQAGDTLFSLANHLNTSYHRLARLNAIRDPDKIQAGQIIYFKPENLSPEALAAIRDALSAPVADSPQSDDGRGWQWPVASGVTRTFARATAPYPGVEPPQRLGINIVSSPGSEILAVAPGKVIYAGLMHVLDYTVLVEHDKQLLSIYAGAEKLYVRRGERVRKGQKLATISASSTMPPSLYFEVRLSGNPVDPLLYLQPIAKEANE